MDVLDVDLVLYDDGFGSSAVEMPTKKKEEKKTEGEKKEIIIPVPGIEPGAVRLLLPGQLKANDVNPYTIPDV